MDPHDCHIPDFYREQYETFYQIYGEDEYQASGRALGVDDREMSTIYKDVLKKLKFCHDDIVLDLGSGSGLLTMKIKEVVRHVHAYDGSETAIAFLQNKLTLNSNVTCVAGDIMDRLPYEDEQFSNILCYSVIHYLGSYENVKNVIDESMRVLRPGGTLLLGDLPMRKVWWEDRLISMLRQAVGTLFHENFYIFLKSIENVLYCLDRKISRQDRSFSRKIKKALTLAPLMAVQNLRSLLTDKNVMKPARKSELKKKVRERIKNYNLYDFLYFDEFNSILQNYKDIHYEWVSQSPSVSYPWQRMDVVIIKK